MTLSYTPRFHLAVPDFLSEPWHAEFAAAMESIDQALYTAIVSQGTTVWVNDHAYTLGDIIIDPMTGTLYAAAVTHTSSSFATSPTFATELLAHPTYWTSFAVIAASQAEAEAGTDNIKYMTPLRTAQAITAQSPTPGIATQVQAQEATDNTQIMTPQRTKEQINARLASPAQAVAGTDNFVLMTPLRVAQQVVATGVAGGDTVGFSAHKNGTNQTGIPNGVVTKVTFGTELYDMGSFYDTANSRWTPPQGQIHLDAHIYISAGITVNSGLFLYIFKNGVVFRQSVTATAFSANDAVVSVDDIANGTDYYEVFVSLTSASTGTVEGTAINSYFMGAFLGEVGTVTLGLAEIGFRASKGGTAQAGIPNATWTKLTFATEEYDQGARYDSATSRWTPPTGLVHIDCAFQANGSISVGGVDSIAVYKNGANLKNSTDTSSSGGLCGGSVSVDDIASGTDYYEAFVFIQTGGPVSVDGAAPVTYFAGHRITGAQGEQGEIGPQGPSGTLVAPITNSGRLRYVNSTTLSFTPFNGDRIKINGVMQQIPTSGILGLNNTSAYVNGASATPLVANTTYYVYVFLNAGSLTADFSTTTHATSNAFSNEGTEIKTGDNTRTLIGMIRTGGTGGVQFLDTSANRLVLSWFNRRSRSMQGAQTGNYLFSGGWQEINSACRVNFLSWGDESTTFHVVGYCQAYDTALGMYGGLCIDQVTSPNLSTYGVVQATWSINLSVSSTFDLSEGYHFMSPMGYAYGYYQLYTLSTNGMIEG